MKERFKTFSCAPTEPRSLEEMEKEINDWLGENHAITVIDRKVRILEPSQICVVLFFYEDHRR